MDANIFNLTYVTWAPSVSFADTICSCSINLVHIKENNNLSIKF